MAKMFYSTEEASSKLGLSEDGLKDLVRTGKLREFRDAGAFNYKIEEVDKLAGELAPSAAAKSSASSAANSASGSGEILLEPVEDSSVEFAGGGSDIISLDGTDLGGSIGGTAGGTAAATKGGTGGGTKGDTVVPSVGVNVFDDEDIDEQVDPLAQTAVEDVAGLGLDAAASGSGILDLTRESDDTSLGQELLDEIYTGDESGSAAPITEDQEDAAEATKAGLEVSDEEEAEVLAEESAQPTSVSGPMVRQVVEYAPDAASSGLSALMIVATVILLLGGLGAAAMVRGITPGLLESLYANLWMFAAVAVGLGLIVAGVAFMLARKKSG